MTVSIGKKTIITLESSEPKTLNHVADAVASVHAALQARLGEASGGAAKPKDIIFIDCGSNNESPRDPIIVMCN